MSQPSTVADIERRFRAMHAASRSEPPPGAAERKAHLAALRAMVAACSEEFAHTINQDYGCRSRSETLMAEIVPSLTVLRDCIGHVGAWMRPERRRRAPLFFPAGNRVYWQPKGVVLIIAPWNYPVQLVIGPLAAALAAGNRVIVKPSEATPATADALKRRVEAALGADRVTVATGGPDVAAALCKLPFDHILFTGSTAVGRKVMAAAAENLTPVTLELGGKSPVIVHEAFDLALAVRRIVRGKLLNAGQTCIAPDYALVPAQRVEDFVRLYQETASRFYPSVVANPDYTSIINQRHYERIIGLVADARAKGGRVAIVDPAKELVPGEAGSANARKIAPVLITGVKDDMAAMQQEIFGPVLPVIAYQRLDEAIACVNARPRPLALYYFDGSRNRTEHVLERTVSGGASVNDTMMHFAQEDLPFGGIGPSGMGAYHGEAGFRTFSHAKGAFRQSRFTLTSQLDPPYGKRFRRLIRFAIRRSTGWRSSAK
jgi:coniferyl-aldehyde dehydrogenase